MKNWIYKILALSMFSLLLGACSKDEVHIVASTGKPSTLSTTSNALVLQKSAQDTKVLSISITKPDFGYDAVVNNTLQIALKGNNFSTVAESGFDANALVKDFTAGAFNTLVLRLGIPTEKASDVELRVKSSISGQYAPVYSNILQMKVTPYSSVSWLYVPGAYQNWTPATADSLISPNGNGIYEGIINFTTGNLAFKILTKKAWGPPEYGKGAAAGTVAIGGGDLTAPNAGIQKVTVDLNANTIDFKPYSFGIIGSATPGGWDKDTDMAYNNGSKLWSVTLPLVPGAVKFRLNDDWGTNYGGANGVLAAGGGDIAITSAGNYKVEMSIAASTYTITKLP